MAGILERHTEYLEWPALLEDDDPAGPGDDEATEVWTPSPKGSRAGRSGRDFHQGWQSGQLSRPTAWARSSWQPWGPEHALGGRLAAVSAYVLAGSAAAVLAVGVWLRLGKSEVADGSEVTPTHGPVSAPRPQPAGAGAAEDARPIGVAAAEAGPWEHSQAVGDLPLAGGTLGDVPWLAPEAVGDDSPAGAHAVGDVPPWRGLQAVGDVSLVGVRMLGDVPWLGAQVVGDVAPVGVRAVGGLPGPASQTGGGAPLGPATPLGLATAPAVTHRDSLAVRDRRVESELLMEMGRSEVSATEALLLLRLAVRRDPRNPHAVAGLAAALLARRRPLQAFRLARRATRLRRNRARYRVLLGDTLAALGLPHSAAVQWRRALQLQLGLKAAQTRLRNAPRAQFWFSPSSADLP